MRDNPLPLWIVLARAFAGLERAAAEDVGRHGLTLSEFGILEALYHLGPLSLGELREKILVSSGGMTWLVDSLEKRGLVSREVGELDRRVRIAKLTASGRELVARIFPEHREALRRGVSGLTVPEQQRATELLLKLMRGPPDNPTDRSDSQRRYR